MTTARNLFRALLVAAVCAATFATCATAWAQDASPPTDGSVIVAPDPAPVDPAPAPDPVPVDPAPAPDAAPPPPPADTTPVEPPADPASASEPEPAPSERRTDSSTTQRVDPPRESGTPSATQTATSAIPASQLAPAAPLPAGVPGEDWAWTEQGDAFVLGTGGSGGDTGRAALAMFAGGSTAAAAGRVPALGSRERAARDAARAYANGSALTASDAGGSGLFASLFGGGGGGGAGGGVLLLTVFGILAVFRLLPPDWNRAFRMSTVIWRPSAYVPPIEHPG